MSAAEALQAQLLEHQQQQQQLAAAVGQLSGGSSVISSSIGQSASSVDEAVVCKPKPFKCPHCPKAFANNSYLSQHMRIHLGIRAFGPCQFCGKKFTQLSHLQQHIRTHTGEKPYKCKYANCEKAFSQLSNLQSHSRCHQSDRPYKCNSCYKCFADEQTLLEHIPRHKESKHLKASSKVHICPFCGKSYSQALYLDKHMTKHTDRRSDMRFPKNVGNVGYCSSSNGSTTAAAAQQLAAAAGNAAMMAVSGLDSAFDPFDGLGQHLGQLDST
uniref:C2H2-type domain-containing protein n=1 Tax=Meloidogyne javanica TaxID=6303 RepID=A0A915N536_MELJA